MKKRLLLLPFLFCFSAIALGHGYVEEPKSRAFLCKKNLNSNCGAIQYEPQSLEGPKGFPPFQGHKMDRLQVQVFPVLLLWMNRRQLDG